MNCFALDVETTTRTKGNPFDSTNKFVLGAIGTDTSYINFTVDNLEEFSAEISIIEDKKELYKLKKVLISARDCYNVIRTFGDKQLKDSIITLKIENLPSMISEVQNHINNINQKEAFTNDDATKLLVNEAMRDITFNFSKIDEEEMKIIAGGVELEEKWNDVINAFTDNYDHEDPELITLREAFMQRFKEKGFVVDSVKEFKEHTKTLDEILKKLKELAVKNNVIRKKYNGDVKYARLHKRVREENESRKTNDKKSIISEYEPEIMNVLLAIKNDVDQKVYERNDILNNDEYFNQVVMKQIKDDMDKMRIENSREDRLFIQVRITKQYLNQYYDTKRA